VFSENPSFLFGGAVSPGWAGLCGLSFHPAILPDRPAQRKTAPPDGYVQAGERKPSSNSGAQATPHLRTGTAQQNTASLSGPEEQGGSRFSEVVPTDDPQVAGRRAKVLGYLTLWNENIGRIWTKKTDTIAEQTEKEKIKVTTEELGAELRKSGAAVRQCWKRYEGEMRNTVKARSESFMNLRRLNSWNQWFGKWLKPRD